MRTDMTTDMVTGMPLRPGTPVLIWALELSHAADPYPIALPIPAVVAPHGEFELRDPAYEGGAWSVLQSYMVADHWPGPDAVPPTTPQGVWLEDCSIGWAVIAESTYAMVLTWGNQPIGDAPTAFDRQAERLKQWLRAGAAVPQGERLPALYTSTWRGRASILQHLKHDMAMSHGVIFAMVLIEFMDMLGMDLQPTRWLEDEIEIVSARRALALNSMLRHAQQQVAELYPEVQP